VRAEPPVATGAGQTLRKLLIVNTADAGGGAERIATTLLDGFPALGTETWLAVGDRRTDHPRVVPFHSSQYVDYRPHAGTATRLTLATRRWIDRRLGLEDFQYPYTRYVVRLTGLPRPDLVLCNNLHGGYFDLRVLPWLSRKVPVVLRLADSWTFTGHCACPPACERWEHGCGACPDLALPPAVARDATRFNWRRKRRIFAGARLFVVAPSRWMLDRARRSLLAPAVQGWRVVPSGVDLGVFRPGSRVEARRRLGLDPEGRLLVFVSNLGAANPNKDYPTLRAAMERLRHGAGPLDLLVVGAEAPPERLGERVAVRHLPHYESRERLADFYRAADLYVHAARDESFCLVAAEALACGTPVVAAAGGGLAEVVEHEATGLLVPPGDAAALAAATRRVLDDPERRLAMGETAARAARERFDDRRMVAEMHAWCVEAAARWRQLPESVAGPVPHALPAGSG
jgi:glycosyltransferase involved in cell wall biosynthesis